MRKRETDMQLMDKGKGVFFGNHIAGEFLRYLMVGGLAFLADYGSLLLLNKVAGLHYLLAATLAFSVGIVVNYIGSIRFVFYQRGMRNVHMERTLFLVIGVLGLLINDGMLFLLTGQAGIPVELSKPITQVVVLLWNFLARKWMLFSPKTKTEEVQD